MFVHHPDPKLIPHWEGYELARDDTHSYVWIWQGFNIRLIAVAHGPDGEWGYDFAWCFPRDPEVVRAAVAAWDGDTQDEPPGWHKRPTREIRRAPRRDEDPAHNRPRCLHGCYIEEGCRTVNCPDDPGSLPPQLRGALDVMAQRGPVVELTAPAAEEDRG